MSILQRNLSTASRSKLYLILGFASLILLFYSVSQIAYVIVEPSDLLGLASHFTVAYWIGLALLLLCSIFTFLDKGLKSNAIFIFILVILGLYLFGIASLVQENVRHPTIYCNLVNVRNILATGHTEITGLDALTVYATWPAAQFTYASILQVTDISLKELMGFMPYFWLICFILITYAIGRRLELSQNMCFLLSFLALSSYWVHQSDASQQAVAILLYLLCFMLLVKPNPRYTVAETILVILCFAALILTHGMTSLTLVAALVVLSIYRYVRHEATPFLLLFPTLLLTWFMYQAYTAFELGVQRWWAAPWDYILRMGMRVEGLYEQTYTMAPVVIQKYSSLAYIFIYGIFIAGAIYLLIRGRVKQDNRRWVLALLMWLIGLAMIGFIYPGREMYVRLFIFGLVPVIGVILKVFSTRRLLIPLMLICMLLILPARYGLEAFWGQMPSSELAGTRFFGTYYDVSSYSGPGEPWVYYREGDIGALAFYNPDLRSSPIWNPRGRASYPTPDHINKAPYKPYYVLGGRRGAQGAEADIVRGWVQSGGADEAALIYNNGNFKIYKAWFE